MSAGNRGQGPRITGLSRNGERRTAFVVPDCQPQQGAAADPNNGLHPSNSPVVIGAAVQPAQIVRGQTGSRGDNGDGTRSR